MRDLSEPLRSALLRAGAALSTAALLLLPMAAESSPPLGAVPDPAPSALPTVAPPGRFGGTARVRDPFRPSVRDDEADGDPHLVLVAFASGVRPIVLVETDGRTKAIAVDDQAFGSRVVYVDAHTIRLADGRSLAVRGRT